MLIRACKQRYCNATIFCVLYFVNFTSAYAITKLGVALLVGVYGSNKRTNVIIDVDFSCLRRSNGYFHGLMRVKVVLASLDCKCPSGWEVM